MTCIFHCISVRWSCFHCSPVCMESSQLQAIWYILRFEKYTWREFSSSALELGTIYKQIWLWCCDMLHRGLGEIYWWTPAVRILVMMFLLGNFGTSSVVVNILSQEYAPHTSIRNAFTNRHQPCCNMLQYFEVPAFTFSALETLLVAYAAIVWLARYTVGCICCHCLTGSLHCRLHMLPLSDWFATLSAI